MGKRSVFIEHVCMSAKYFATLDAKSGYWQLELKEESQRYTCSITEWGLYRYCRAPMGLVSSEDIFCQRTDAALAGVPGMQKLVDDILVTGRIKSELLERIEQILKRC